MHKAVLADSRSWYLYVLLNPDGIAYTGVAKDVALRLRQHNSGTGARFTRGRGPWRILHVEGPMGQGDALRRERQVKRDRVFKAALKTSLAPFLTRPGDLPKEGGAYLLLLVLARELPVRLPGRTDAVLAAGRYLYCGSAKGPGGIAARVGRHMRPVKALRWHVDQLSSAGRVVGAWVFPDGDECRLFAALAEMPTPLPGFGSSDCKICQSHLKAWPPGIALPAFLALPAEDL
jgi:Uri superfamily endonuclease/predicted GIY-YIG superfamily endonuclease